MLYSLFYDLLPEQNVQQTAVVAFGLNRAYHYYARDWFPAVRAGTSTLPNVIIIIIIIINNNNNEQHQCHLQETLLSQAHSATLRIGPIIQFRKKMLSHLGLLLIVTITDDPCLYIGRKCCHVVVDVVKFPWTVRVASSVFVLVSETVVQWRRQTR